MAPGFSDEPIVAVSLARVCAMSAWAHRPMARDVRRGRAPGWRQAAAAIQEGKEGVTDTSGCVEVVAESGCHEWLLFSGPEQQHPPPPSERPCARMASVAIGQGAVSASRTSQHTKLDQIVLKVV